MVENGLALYEEFGTTITLFKTAVCNQYLRDTYVLDKKFQLQEVCFRYRLHVHGWESWIGEGHLLVCP